MLQPIAAWILVLAVRVLDLDPDIPDAGLKLADLDPKPDGVPRDCVAVGNEGRPAGIRDAGVGDLHDLAASWIEAHERRRVQVHNGRGEDVIRLTGRPGVVCDLVVEGAVRMVGDPVDRKSTRLNSSHGYISYAVFCLKKKRIYK